MRQEEQQFKEQGINVEEVNWGSCTHQRTMLHTPSQAGSQSERIRGDGHMVWLV